MPTPASETTRLDSLTGLRFFAALFVLLLHSTNLLQEGLPGFHLWLFGGLGVPFFFVLSGFVLTWTARPEDSAGAFWRRRAARVLPLYFTMLVVSDIAVHVLSFHSGHFVSQGTPAQQRVLPWLSVGIVQGWYAPVSGLFAIPGPASPNPPGWSLSDELFFYALFPLIIPWATQLRRRGAAVLLLGVVGFLAAFAIIAGDADWLIFFPPFMLGFFVAGIATAVAVRERQWFPPMWVTTIGLVVVAGILYDLSRRGAVIAGEYTLIQLLSLPVMVTLIGAAARADIRRTWSPFRHPWLVTLGVWSFALYLVQMTCLMIADAVLPGGVLSFDRRLSGLEEIVFILFVILVAAAAHRFIEEPANRRLRHAPPSVLSEQEHAGAAA